MGANLRIGARCDPDPHVCEAFQYKTTDAGRIWPESARLAPNPPTSGMATELGTPVMEAKG